MPRSTEGPSGVTNLPLRPRIYHITHVDNLPDIVAEGALLSDRQMVARGGPAVSIGMPGVKSDRLEKPLRCHPGDFVGDYVPFNLCPRSVMLYVIYRADHSSLSYRKGQNEIVHLEADLHNVIDWADRMGVRWALTDRNARTHYGRSFATKAGIPELDWDAIANNDFSTPEVKDLKQAEFLLHERFPWDLVDSVATRSLDIAARATSAIAPSSHVPPVVVEPRYYF